MTAPASAGHAGRNPESKCSDEAERKRQIAMFAYVTKWLAVMSALTAAVHVPVYLATSDPRVLINVALCTVFVLFIALIRNRAVNIVHATYLIGVLISIGQIAVAVFVDSPTALLPVAAGILPALFVGLILTPRHILRVLVLAFLSPMTIQWIDRAATWERFDISAWLPLHAAVYGIVNATIAFLVVTLFRNLDQSIRSARESARQLNLLYETSRLFGQAETLDDLLATVAHQLPGVIDATGCFIVLRDPVSGTLTPAFADDRQRETYRRLQVRLEEPSVALAAVRRRAPIVIEDGHASPLVNPHITSKFPALSLMALPLIYREEALGAILITDSRHPRRFTPDEIERVYSLVQQVAAEIANAQAAERERRQATDLAILNRVSAAVATSLDPAEVCRLIVQEISQAAHYEMVSVYLVEGQWMLLQAVIGYDTVLDRLSVERGVMGKTARTGEPILLTDVTTDPDFLAAMPGIASEACAPIRFGGETLGVINIETRAPHTLGVNDMNLLVAIAAQIAVTLRNAQLFEQTRRHGEDLWFLHNMADATAATLDAAQVMGLVGNGLMRSLGVEGCAFSRWDHARECVITIGEYRLENGQTIALADDLGQAYSLDAYPVTRQCLLTQSIRQIRKDMPDAPPEEVALLRQTGFASALFLPLVTPAGVLGMIELYDKENREFDPNEAARGMATANLAAIALERARLFDSERHSRQVTETLLEVTRALGSTLDLDKLLNLILDQLRTLIPYVSGSIAMLDPDGSHYTVRAAYGSPPSLLSRPLVFDTTTTPTARRLMATRRPYRIADTRANVDWLTFENLEHIQSWLGLPLLQNDQVSGFLMIDHSQPGFFTEEHEQLAEAFAQHAAIAIENARLLDQARQQAQRERLVRDITSRISASIDVDTVMQTAVDEVGRALNVSRCLIRLGADPDNMPVAYEFNQPNIPALGVGNLDHLPMLSTALREVRTVVDHEPRLVGGMSVRCSLITPILVRGRVAGALAAHCDQPRLDIPEEIALVEDVSAQMGIAIDNARLYQEATHTLSDLGLLHNIAIAVASAASLPEAVNRVVESVHAAMRQGHVVLQLVDPQTSDLVVCASIGYGRDVSQVRIKIGQNVTGWVAQTGQPVLLPDAHADPRFFDASIDGSIRSELAVPLTAGAEVVGVLNVESAKLDAFDERDLRLLSTLGSNLAMIIRNLRLLDEVRDANARLRELDRLKSQFLANMSHELRTPLNAIIGFSEVLSDGLAGELNPEQREFVDDIHSSGQHLLELINGILDLSKIQAGKMTLDRHAVRPAEVAGEVRSVIAALLAKKNQDFVLELEPGLPAVFADAFRLKQILLNLLSNAHKFSPRNSRIILAAKRESDRVRFSVIDAGDGIPPQSHDLVFQEFAQIDNSSTRQQEGTGLGLPICRRLVEMHEGRIWIESRGVPGEGAALHFTMPVAPAVGRRSRVEDGQFSGLPARPVPETMEVTL